MKQLLEKIIRMRNPQFRFDDSISFATIVAFTTDQCWALFRGCSIFLRGRNPKRMLRGRGVHFFNLRAITWGRYLKLGDHVYISALGKAGVCFGDNVGIGAFSRVVISTSMNNAGSFIRIGNDVGVGEFAYLGGAGGLQIGNQCIIGQYFSCHPENHIYDDPGIAIRHQGTTRKGIYIGDDCWIGSKVTILDGVSIGKGSVIAAGAVVTKSFPPYSVIGGVPAKIIATRGQSLCSSLTSNAKIS